MKRLLIVEDEKEIRRGIRAMAERAPGGADPGHAWEILECRSGTEALQLLRDTPVDAMITDIRMPGMDGIELVRNAAALPVPPLAVVVSGYDDFEYAVELLRLGVRDYILKPVERERVFEVLAKLDAELAENDRSRHGRRAANLQLVRSLLLDARTGTLARELEGYGDLLGEGPFVAVCACGAESAQPPGCLYTLWEMEGHTLYIQPAQELPALREAFGDGDGAACLGVSGPFGDVEGLREAYRQAVACRGLAFIGGATRHAALAASAPGNAAGNTDDIVVGAEMEQVVHLLGALNVKEAKQALGQLLLRAQNGGMDPAAFAGEMARLARRLAEVYGALAEGAADFSNPWRWRAAYSYYLDFCAWMEALSERLRQSYEDKAQKKIHAALVYLRENFRSEIDMAVVSNHVSMNYTQFSYLFKQHTGEGFLDYLKNLRLAESRRLLEETDLRVREVSLRSGFKNEKHFMKTFKAAMAVSPSEYRRNLRGGEGLDEIP